MVRYDANPCFPNYLTTIQVGAQDYLFVLQQDKYISVRSILSDTLEAVEYDFGLRLSIMLGAGLVTECSTILVRLNQG